MKEKWHFDLDPEMIVTIVSGILGGVLGPLILRALGLI